MFDGSRADEIRVLVDSTQLYEVLFRTGEHLYSFVIAPAGSGGESHYSCGFALCDHDGIPAHFGIAGTGDQHRVLPTVVSLLRHWMRSHMPAEMSFVAKELSREKLYRRMLGRTAGELGYVVSENRRTLSQTVFTLTVAPAFSEPFWKRSLRRFLRDRRVKAPQEKGE